MKSELNFLRKYWKNHVILILIGLPFFLNPFPNFLKVRDRNCSVKSRSGTTKVNAQCHDRHTSHSLCRHATLLSSSFFPPIKKKKEMQGALRDELWRGGVVLDQYFGIGDPGGFETLT